MPKFNQKILFAIADLARRHVHGAEHRRLKQKRLGFEQLEDRHQLATDLPPLIDINTDPNYYSSRPSSFIDVGGTIFFVAATPTAGRELWKTDGTEIGTLLVKDILEGSGSAIPNYLTNVNGTLFFTAFDGVGNSLWKSDGTAVGTIKVKEMLEGGSPFFFGPRNLTNVDGALFFLVPLINGDSELWKSDGTPEGTLTVKEGLSINSSFGLANVNGKLFFNARSSVYGDELWKSDGTVEGTMMVKDILPGSQSANPMKLTNVNGTLYFSAFDGSNLQSFWKSDGTAAGTVKVSDIRVNPSGTLNFTHVNGTIYLNASDGTSGYELWKSDGTSDGTVLVKDICQGSCGSGPWFFTNVNGTLFFVANNGGDGSGLWKSDGTAANTVLVKDFRAGSGSTLTKYLTNVDGTLYFRANDGFRGTGVWRSDGTEAGTVMAKDFFEGIGLVGLGTPVSVNGELYFGANDGTSGYELWKSDDTVAGTQMVRDISPGSTGGSSSSPDNFIAINETLYFSANDGTNGVEVWKSDGTAAGTRMVKDVLMGSDSADPKYFTNVNGILYFTAIDIDTGRELWKSDGTVAGTVLVKDILEGTVSSNPRNLTEVDGILYFSVSEDINGTELWKSDGTTAGTEMVKDIFAGIGSASPSNFVNIDGTLYFSASDGNNGRELWKSDGTTVGTVMIKDIRLGSGGSSPTYLTNVDGTLFFIANDGVSGVELWKSDGTTEGTFLIKDIRSNGFGIFRFLTNVDGTLFFIANDGVSGDELWKSDGTSDGTVMVRDVREGPGSANPSQLTNINGMLYFRAVDGETGYQLWRSDGTFEGTGIVKDIGSALPSSLTNVNGILYFRANDNLWKSDGTEDGTVKVLEFSGAASLLVSRSIVPIGDKLFFVASTETYGTELYMLPLTSSPSALELSSSAIDERLPSGTIIGNFISRDTDENELFIYSFATGEGDVDNSSFVIDGNTLKSGVVFDFETKSTYSIRVRSTDSTPQHLEQVFVVTINDINELWDFGDAPAQYPVTLSEDGARHVIGPMKLGSLIDSEPDGQPNANAGLGGEGGDDNTELADEDGVTLIASAVQVAGSETVSSFLVNSSGTGKLYAWIDFNRDHVWSSAEQIIAGVDVVAGDNVINYTIPNTAVAGNLAARFRLSTASNLLPTGEAPDGEVEDYLVTILDGASPVQVELHPPKEDVTRIDFNSSNVIIVNAGVTIFAAPASATNGLYVTGTGADETLHLASLPASGAFALKWNAGEGSDTLKMDSNVTEFDLTTKAAGDLTNIETIDLSGAGNTKLKLDATSVPQASDGKVLRLRLGVGDVLVVPAHSRVTGHRIEDSEIIRTGTLGDSNVSVEFVSAARWQNSFNPLDVDGNGWIEPLDALLLINELNSQRIADANGLLPESVLPLVTLFLDPTGDNRLEPIDVLLIINAINRGPGETEQSTDPSVAHLPPDIRLNHFRADNDRRRSVDSAFFNWSNGQDG